jgi:hypothetical protein
MTFSTPVVKSSLKKWLDREPWRLGVFALPVLQIKNLIFYVSTRETLAAKVGTAICFLPVITITTAVWLTAWYLAIAIIWRLLGLQ